MNIIQLHLLLFRDNLKSISWHAERRVLAGKLGMLLISFIMLFRQA